MEFDTLQVSILQSFRNTYSMALDREREKRLRTTGKWFVKQKKDKWLWINWAFPLALIISLFFYIITELL